MARKSKEAAQKTRTRILSSALALFTKKGYDHTTFTDIAARLKMTKGAVYWHFKDKESLLLALIDEMSDSFQKRMAQLMPEQTLTYPAVAQIMIRHAELLLKDARSKAFFLLMNERIQWSSTSMTLVREELLRVDRFSPCSVFVTALTNDLKSGRLKKETNIEHIASISVAAWSGLLRVQISGFELQSIMPMLETAYRALWHEIRSEASDEFQKPTV